MHVLVTGASGFVGSAVVARLLAAGHRVTGLARSQSSADRLAAGGAHVHRADLSDLAEPAAAREAVARVDGVVHLAYRHGDAAEDAARTDQQVITALGSALAGSGRPMVVTSGTLVVPAGQVATEDDEASPAAPAGARSGSEDLALGLVDRGVRACVVRLAPCVHDRVRRGFAGALVDAARRAGAAGYLGDGSQRWPAVHRQDAAALFRLAVERAPAGSVLHAVDEEGVRLRAVAELIGERLGLPVLPVPAARAETHFGWLAALAGIDAPASSARTRHLLGWQPAGAALLEDMANGDFFADEGAAVRPIGRPR